MSEVEIGKAGAHFLEGLFEHLDMAVEVSPGEKRDEGLVFALAGDSSESLKRRPDLHDAITLLASQVVSREAGARVRCLLDVGGDFEERSEFLQAVANDVGGAVKRSGRRGVIAGLSSAERRVVHEVLKEMDGVASRSEGDDDRRCLLVERA
jgi:spoIIIJ-associated protein